MSMVTMMTTTESSVCGTHDNHRFLLSQTTMATIDFCTSDDNDNYRILYQ